MASVLSAVWLTVGFLVLQAGVILVAALLAPGATDRTAAVLRARPVLSLLIGAAIWFVVLQWVSFGTGPMQRPLLLDILEDVHYNFGQLRPSLRGSLPGRGQVVVWLLGGPLFALFCLGLAGLARVLSETFHSRWGAGAAGSLVGAALCLAGIVVAPVLAEVYLLPWTATLNRNFYPAIVIPVSVAIGWEVLLPLLSCAAVGAGCLAMLPMKSHEPGKVRGGVAPEERAPEGVHATEAE